MKLDYGKLGLRVGLELHQELDTHKLFCNCPSELREEEPTLEVKRRLRPTQSELGEVDRAALAEAIKGKGFRYQLYPDTICLVELDDEPPHPINDEALDIALEIALLLNARPVDEVHAMRKIVIDGSNTCGFQRTLLIATDGYIETGQGRVRVPTICLEEDAARKIEEGVELIDYRLDRLGIPLVEIVTGSDFSDPQTPTKVALYIGRLMRATGKVKRGIGTIRQDINISIAGGARQEIKGVQELALISGVIEREVQRQLALLGIRGELKRRGATKVEKQFLDVSEVFSSTGLRVIKDALAAGGVVLAVKLPGFAGLVGKELQPGRRLGTELADHARLYGKVGGIFHTDELPTGGISEAEVGQLKGALETTERDAIVIVADLKGKAEAALSAVVDRANQALDGVPEETRRALPDGNTEFMRPLPGAGRMYPETDIEPIPITRERLRQIRARLPELPERRRARLVKKYRLGKELAERMSLSENLELFEELVRKSRASPTLVATTLEETLVSLGREGVRVEAIQKTALEELFAGVAKRKLAKEAVPEVLREVARGVSVRAAVEKLKLEAMGMVELRKLVREVVESNRELIERRGRAAIASLMGILMGKVRGRADGKMVYELLERELRRVR